MISDEWYHVPNRPDLVFNKSETERQLMSDFSSVSKIVNRNQAIQNARKGTRKYYAFINQPKGNMSHGIIYATTAFSSTEPPGVPQSKFVSTLGQFQIFPEKYLYVDSNGNYIYDEDNIDTFLRDQYAMSKKATYSKTGFAELYPPMQFPQYYTSQELKELQDLRTLQYH